MDMEKVMTWLEICGKNNDCSGCCPYSENGFGEYGRCRESLMADAYDLLKEQEAVVPVYTTNSHPFHIGILYHCGNCHHSLIRDEDLFCRHCGKPIDWTKKAVKWE